MEETDMCKMRYRPGLLVAIIALMLATQTKADEFFNLVAAGSGGTTVASGGPDILHLTDNLIGLNSSYAQLVGQNVTSSLSWGGVSNAIVFTENASQTSATLKFPTTG